MTPTKEQIKQARQQAGLSQTAAAALIHSTLRTWQDWEAGKAKMHPGLWELFNSKTNRAPGSAPRKEIMDTQDKDGSSHTPTAADAGGLGPCCDPRFIALAEKQFGKGAHLAGNIFDALDAVLTDRAPATSAAALPDGYVLMPERLTAENSAKAALSGEFSETYMVTCHECDGSGDDASSDSDAECPECKGDGEVQAAITVGWDTIKEIYARAVEVCAHTPTAKGAADLEGGA